MGRLIEFRTGRDWENVLLADEIAQKDDFSTVIVNASLDGIITYDLNSCYTLWNPQMERLSGLKSEYVLGKNAFELFPFMKEVGLDKLYEASFRGETMQSPTYPYIVPATGIMGYGQQTNFPLYNEHGEITGGIAVVRDMTAMKEKFDELNQTNSLLENRVRELEKQLERKNRESSWIQKLGLYRLGF